MMYEGIKNKSFYYEPKKKLYRGVYLNEKEILNIQNFIKLKFKDLPTATIYIKSFIAVILY